MPLLHSLHRSPRTLPVVWQWSTANRFHLPVGAAVAQIAHFPPCCSSIASKSCVVMPYLRMFCFLELMAYASGLRAFQFCTAALAFSGCRSLHRFPLGRARNSSRVIPCLTHSPSFRCFVLGTSLLHRHSLVTGYAQYTQLVRANEQTGDKPGCIICVLKTTRRDDVIHLHMLLFEELAA